MSNNNALYILDIEYPGRFEEIKSRVVSRIKNWNMVFESDRLSYERISKKSMAHKVAHEAWKNKSASYRLTAEKIIKILSK